MSTSPFVHSLPVGNKLFMAQIFKILVFIISYLVGKEQEAWINFIAKQLAAPSRPLDWPHNTSTELYQSYISNQNLTAISVEPFKKPVSGGEGERSSTSNTQLQSRATHHKIFLKLWQNHWQLFLCAHLWIFIFFCYFLFFFIFFF